MNKILLLAVVTFSFITIASAQQTVEKTVYKESTIKEVKKCDPNCKKECSEKKAACKSKKCSADCKKPCCADKKAACKTKKCDADCKKECCANKKTECKKEGGKCSADCKKPCSANKNVKTEKKNVIEKIEQKGTKVAFSCPMKCEGDKTYDKEGSCPKCKMDLKPVKN